MRSMMRALTGGNTVADDGGESDLPLRVLLEAQPSHFVKTLEHKCGLQVSAGDVWSDPPVPA